MSYKDKPQVKLYKYENASFVLQAIIDDYQEVSFEHNIYEAGTFTITINYNIPNALKFERGMFVQFGNNPYDFGEIYSIQDEIGQDGKGSQIRTITGRDARYILKRRVIKNMNSNGLWAMTDKGEVVLRNLIKDQCGTSAEAKRQLPISNTIPASADAKGKVYSVSENFTNLYEVCKTIATQSEIGWRMAFDGSSLSLEVFEGADLSQTVRFDTNFESLANGEFSDSSESYSNAIYIGGKGQNDDRDIYEGEDGTPEGLDRFESWDNQSSLTVESEYEAEALSMLTQYGQTLTMNGNGLAKCPYVFREQYDIGDTVTVAFSGKSAKAQILSITEHWTWGAYDISFAFGKPQNNLSDQLQLMLRKIQEASNKTNSTDSVRWYTIPTDTAMPKADVTYNTIGFVGTVGTNATFTLYLDNQKTGAKTYHVYFKQLGGSGKLTLTTGKAGASNLVMNVGTYVAIIYVDENGNVRVGASTPTSTIASGNNQPATSEAVANYKTDTVTSGSDIPVTSGAVAEAVQEIKTVESSLPTDAVLHYSFDEVPDYPDGTAKLKYDNNFTDTIGWNGSATVSVSNGKLVFDATAGQYKCYNISLSANDIIILKGVATKSATLTVMVRHSGASSDTGLKSVALTQGQYFEIAVVVDATSTNFNLYSPSAWGVIISQLYVGNGSYTTPIIDNANGQNNGTNNGAIAVQGVSGKGIYFPKANQYVSILITNLPAPTSNDNFAISVWINFSTDYTGDSTSSYKPIVTIGSFTGTFGLFRSQNGLGIICRDSVSSRTYVTTIKKGQWCNYVMVYDGTTHTCKLFENGVLLGSTVANIADYQFGSGASNWKIWSNEVISGNASTTTNQPATLDDILIFNRALSQEEVTALYFNKANTPKYYDINNYNVSFLIITTAEFSSTYNVLTVAEDMLKENKFRIKYVSVADNSAYKAGAPYYFTVYEIRQKNDTVVVNATNYLNGNVITNGRSRSGSWAGWKEIPSITPPSTNGKYSLLCSVVSGVPTYGWGGVVAGETIGGLGASTSYTFTLPKINKYRVLKGVFIGGNNKTMEFDITYGYGQNNQMSIPSITSLSDKLTMTYDRTACTITFTTSSEVFYTVMYSIREIENWLGIPNIT